MPSLGASSHLGERPAGLGNPQRRQGHPNRRMRALRWPGTVSYGRGPWCGDAAARPGRRVRLVSLVDRRLIAESRPARRQLGLTVLFSLVTAGLVLGQAGLLTSVIVGASSGQPFVALRGGLFALFLVVCLRAATAFAAETTAL